MPSNGAKKSTALSSDNASSDTVRSGGRRNRKWRRGTSALDGEADLLINRHSSDTRYPPLVSVILTNLRWTSTPSVLSIRSAASSST